MEIIFFTIFPQSCFLSSFSSSSSFFFFFAEDLSLCCDVQPYFIESTREQAKGYSQLPMAHFPSSWSMVAFMEVGLPV